MFAPADYHFELPPELIAQQPAAQRDASRLLHVSADGNLADLAFPDIVELLPRDAVIIANDTRVIPARVVGTKETGGNVELLFLEPVPELAAPEGTTAWRCLARARRPLRTGQEIRVTGSAVVLSLVAGRDPADGTVVVAAPGDGLAFLDAHGMLPLPHYIERTADADDRERYQTMFARVPGAVAAPTAGLHMTPAIAEQLTARGATFATVTLHVGWGTFAPIRTDDIRGHAMHRERYDIPEATAALVASGRPIVALGTTTLRALEASARTLGTRAVAPGPTSTDIFIYPGSGHQFHVVDHLITNFHLPASTLLMLVSAFAGSDRIRAAYAHAVAQRYRFFSYGDAMLVHRA